jgi:hypothetical protein
MARTGGIRAGDVTGGAIGVLLERGLALPLVVSGVCVLAATVCAAGSVPAGVEPTL